MTSTIRTLIRLTCCAFLVSTVVANGEQFRFVALGDTAYYGEPDKKVYRELIDTINEAKPAFSIHVGDIWGAAHCVRERYEEIRQTFRRFDHPVVYTPGDNEWTDCSRVAYGGFAPHTRLKLLREVFFTTAESQGSRPMPVVRQSNISPFTDYSENSRWMYGGVLFFTLHVSGSSNNYVFDDDDEIQEALARTKANVAWLRDGFRIARTHDLAGVVIAFHAEMFRNGNAGEGWGTPYMPIIEEIQLAADRFDNPILLIHGDTHQFVIDRPFVQPGSGSSVPRRTHVIRLEVFGSPETRAVEVSVDTDTKHLFGFSPLYNQ